MATTRSQRESGNTATPFSVAHPQILLGRVKHSIAAMMEATLRSLKPLNNHSCGIPETSVDKKI